MGYPSYMNDEELAAFGFVPNKDDPSTAQHLVYPKLTVRYRCPNCNIWSGRLFGGKVPVCPQCHKGGRPIKSTKQFLKVYSCCQDWSCETWRQFLSLLEDAGVGFEKCHDGFGGHIQLQFPKSWSEQDRIDFHYRINDFCVSKHGARKAKCSKSKKPRSKLPGTT